MNYYAFIAAMVVYGALHGLGMAVIYLILGVALVGTLAVGKRIVEQFEEVIT